MGGTVSIPTDQSRTLKVIGAGYSRTGTLSMAMALEKLLDGPTMHGGTQLLGREDAYVHLWTRIFTAHASKDKQLLLKLLREATAGFVGITDAPGNCFVAELLELYPDAEVICVQRDREKWWNSWKFATNTAGQGFLSWFLMPVPGKRWFPGLLIQFLEQQERAFGPNSIDRMDRHNEYVKRVTPPEKFHMMILSEGWAPLCRILQVPIPDEPFPRANDVEAVEGFASRLLIDAATRWIAIVSAVGLLVYGAHWAWVSMND